MAVVEIRTHELRRMPKATERSRAVQFGRTAKRVRGILSVLRRRVQDALVHVGIRRADVTPCATADAVEHRSAALRGIGIEASVDRLWSFQAELICAQRRELR